ncbi:MAG: hypothetical protein QXU40_00385 [Candidatus Pacearchaeota archaeon]
MLIYLNKNNNLKRAIEVEILAWWIIALVILIVIAIGYFILKEKGIGALDYLKNMFRFRV